MKKKILSLLVTTLIASSLIGSSSYQKANAFATNTAQMLLNKSKVTMEVGSYFKLSLGDINPTEISWSSNNKEVAIIYKKGTIKAIAKGSAIITAVHNNTTYTCSVTIVNSNDSSDELELSSMKLPELKTITTFGSNQSYLDINDATFTKGLVPSVAFLTKCANAKAYITSTSSPSLGVIRFYFNVPIKSSEIIEISYSLSTANLENHNKGETTEKEVDLAIFMGQSNMSGIGTASLAPVVSSEKGSEFRAITDPTTLYDIVEPFGKNENNTNGLYDGTSKSGSMISSFVNAYYAQTNTKLICVSATQSATPIANFAPDSNNLNDAIARFDSAIAYLTEQGYTIKNKFVVWCQGETDGRLGTSYDQYTSSLEAIIDEMVSHGADHFYMVRIGNNREDATLYDTIIKAQTDLCKSNSHAILVSTKFSIMAANNMMVDSYHYIQEGYNMTGFDAGSNVAYHILTKTEPCMYDYEYDMDYNPQDPVVTPAP